ncbi:MAG TPA: transglutaminase domain-containing protein [Armatimonadota bacterium]|nr:transglutaminase domain-containing protein [Armatimonadota bacterium]
MRWPGWLTLLPGWRARLRVLLPLYIATWLAGYCALLGLGSVSSDPELLTITGTLMTLGFILSLVLRLASIPRRAILLLLGCVGLVLGLLQLRQFTVSVPGSAAVAPSILPALGFAWLLVILSYTLVTNDWLLFVIPLSLAILGLSGTENPNPDMSGYFLVFAVASLFAVSYHNYLRYVPVQRLGDTSEVLGPVLRWQVVATAALFAGVSMLTAVVAVPLNQAGSVGVYRFRIRATPLLQSLAALRYHVMGREIRIGLGPSALSEREVFHIESSEPAYWRIRTYDRYTGNGWVDSIEGLPQRVLATARGTAWEMVLPGSVDQGRGARAHREWLAQRVRVVGHWDSSALLAAAEPAVVRFATYPGPLLITPSGSVHLVNIPYLTAGLSYEVVSDVLRASPVALRSAPPASEIHDPALAAMLAPYLRVPNSAWRLQAEAERLTAGLKNDYDRAAAIEAWLSGNYVYNLQVSPVPEGQDAVMHFLYTAKEGYCDLFASAMVLLCRAAGIPARLATGFSGGTRDPETGSIVVRERDAHAWPEVYFHGYGWVTFEPTPASGEDLISQYQKGGWSLLTSRIRRVLTFPVLILSLVGLLSLHLVRLVAYDPWRRRRDLLARSGEDARGRVLRAYYTALHHLRRHYPRQAFETPAEYARTVTARAGSASWLPALEILTDLFLAARFGHDPVTEKDARLAEASLGRIVAGLKRH